MKVYELIDALKLCDLSKEVYGYLHNGIHTLSIDDIDELSDRVDLNIGGGNLRSLYKLIETTNGYMALDCVRDEYLEDEHGDNLFDDVNDANKLIEDAVFTNMEHREAV